MALHVGRAERKGSMARRKQVLARTYPGRERKQERKELGKLRHQVVSEKTEHRYFLHVSRFLTFLMSHGKPYPRTFPVVGF